MDSIDPLKAPAPRAKSLPTLSADKTAQCLDDSFHLFAAAAIFGKRANKIRKNQSVLLLSAILPFVLGLASLKLGSNTPIPPIVYSIFSAALFFVSVISFIALIKNWTGKLSYYVESEAHNYKLAADYKKLANSVESKGKVEAEYIRLETESAGRTKSDLVHSFSVNEKRWGSRSALWNYQWKCKVCRKVPKDMNPTECSACGAF